MKYRLAGVLALGAMLLALGVAAVLRQSGPSHRVHQHLTARQPDVYKRQVHGRDDGPGQHQ